MGIASRVELIRRKTLSPWIFSTLLAVFAALAVTWISLAPEAAQAQAQSYRFNSVSVEGNQRVDAATVLSYAGLSRGQRVSAAQLNDAYQSILGSGLFEKVELLPQGSRLVIRVKEYPTINQISIEGNRRLKDEVLLPLIKSKPRRVYSPTQAEADAAEITKAYTDQGRITATVVPKIIQRSENRVDLVFEIGEGRVVEIERLSFVGNRHFSDRRLRRVLGTKQAGLLRQFIRSDTFVADRIEFDKQLLRDFYQSRGYVDFKTLSVSSELTRNRNAFLITFNVQEGQSFNFGKITAVSDLPDVDPAEFQAAIRIRPGSTYNPTAVDNTILRLERLALRKGLDFIRVEPRVTRNDRDLTLDIEFVISKGPRVFVERIDIQGNTTTLDRVIRRQFTTAEGDPFNPRAIRNSAERVRALNFFETADVNARQGSAPDQVIVDVKVKEKPTGSLTFGASYGQDSGFGVNLSFDEKNFLGRGQSLGVSFNTAAATRAGSINFYEPYFLGRDLGFRLSLGYFRSNYANSYYDTRQASIRPAFDFPVSENGRLSVYYLASRDGISNVDANATPVIKNEAARGELLTSAFGYNYAFDNRKTGLNPKGGVLLSFGQEIAGLGGDTKYIKTSARAAVQTKVLREEVTLQASLEGGVLRMLSGNSRVTDRYRLNGLMRGFEANGIGPRDLNTTNQDAIGGNYFAVAKLEAQFPLGLPEEYGITGGLFLDMGSVWDIKNVDTTGVGPQPIDGAFRLRSVIGASILWTTPIGPLRFNFSQALKKESYDKERKFDLTISTQF